MRNALIAACLAWIFYTGPAPAAEIVDLELVLAVDISGSMDTEEQRVQREGYVAALRHPDVLRAIQHGAYGRIAITYVEWAGPEFQFVTVPWTLVDGPQSAWMLGEAIADVPLRRFRGTSISSALKLAAAQFDGSAYQGIRRVIDVSGDGANNMGPPVAPIRDQIVEQDIVINGLPLLLRPSAGGWDISDLDVYYADCVIGGPGAFVIPVRSIDEFPQAVRRKLVLEIAGLAPLRAQTIVPAQSGRATDCGIGERQRRMWGDP